MKTIANISMNPHGRPASIRAVIFFLMAFIASLLFGVWLTYNFGWGADSEHHLKTIGFSLGLLMLASTTLPMWFCFALIRQLRSTKH